VYAPRSIAEAGLRRWLLILFLVASALRLGWVTARYGGPHRPASLAYPDEEAYCRLAQSLAAGTGLVDEFGYRATYMPGYPAFLAVFAGLSHPWFWARIVQALLAAWVAPATFLLARQWLGLCGQPNTRPPLIPIMAGLAAACDPFLVFFSGLLLTETLFAAALVTFWGVVLFMSRKSSPASRPHSLFARLLHTQAHGSQPVGFPYSLLAGVLLLICVLLRPSAIVLVLAGPLGVLACRRFDRAGLVYGAVMAGVLVCGLLPWAARNAWIIGQWHWLTTRGGISLYDGWREGATGASDLAHTKTLPEVAGMSEIEWDAYFRARAWSAARADPLRLLRLACRKTLRTWNPLPNVEEHRRGFIPVLSAAWVIILLLFAAVGWWRARRAVSGWLMLLLPVACFTLLHAILVGSVRYRVPVMPLVMVLSATGLAAVLRRVRPASCRSPDRLEASPTCSTGTGSKPGGPGGLGE